MMEGSNGNLSSEDQERMRRLTEEISARYYEMGTIMERTLGSSGLRERALSPGGKITRSTLAMADGEVCICTDVGDGHYIDPPGECATGPCADVVVK